MAELRRRRDRRPGRSIDKVTIADRVFKFYTRDLQTKNADRSLRMQRAEIGTNFGPSLRWRQFSMHRAVTLSRAAASSWRTR